MPKRPRKASYVTASSNGNLAVASHIPFKTTEKCSKRRTLISGGVPEKKQRAIRKQDLTAARLIAWSAKGPYRKGITAWQRTQKKRQLYGYCKCQLYSMLEAEDGLFVALPLRHSLENRDYATSAPFKQALLLVNCVFNASNTSGQHQLVPFATGDLISHCQPPSPSRNLPFSGKYVANI